MEKAIIWALAIALFLNIFAFDFMVAHGHSMEPAIQNGAVLVVSRLHFGLRLPWRQGYLIRWRTPRVGEIVVFYTPLGELAVKRIGALVGNDFFLAMGDNSLMSIDSRSYGPVPIGNILGRVVWY
ncbi:MAG: S26 family signal peptidase [Spirochaetes bacterium]|nr:S26 family signal peptidase [Spirochaetota bacterium]